MGKALWQKTEFEEWQEGKRELSLGIACDGLIGATSSLHNELRAIGITDTLFDQKTKTTEGGWVRRAFSGISDWTHSRPGFTDSSIRKSNGPIYVRGAFNHSAWIQTEIVGLLFVLLLISCPSTRLNQVALDLFDDPSEVKSRVTRVRSLCFTPHKSLELFSSHAVNEHKKQPFIVDGQCRAHARLHPRMKSVDRPPLKRLYFDTNAAYRTRLPNSGRCSICLGMQKQAFTFPRLSKANLKRNFSGISMNSQPRSARNTAI